MLSQSVHRLSKCLSFVNLFIPNNRLPRHERTLSKRVIDLTNASYLHSSCSFHIYLWKPKCCNNYPLVNYWFFSIFFFFWVLYLFWLICSLYWRHLCFWYKSHSNIKQGLSRALDFSFFQPNTWFTDQRLSNLAKRPTFFTRKTFFSQKDQRWSTP